MRNLKPSDHLCRFQARIEGNFRTGIIWYEDDSYFLIQNGSYGSSPRSNEWQKYGKCSWTVSEGTSSHCRAADVDRLAIFEKIDAGWDESPTSPTPSTPLKRTVKSKDPDSVKVELKLPTRSPIKLSVESEISIKLK